MTQPVTLTLADFLLARIAEDKAAANEILDTPPAPVEPRPAAVRLLNRLGQKVLAECEAKRQIVADFVPLLAETDGVIYSEWGNDDDLEGKMLRLLAQAYADHPDFRPEWRA